MGFFFNGIFYCNHSEQDVNRRSHWAYDEDIIQIGQPLVVMATVSFPHFVLLRVQIYVKAGIALTFKPYFIVYLGK